MYKQVQTSMSSIAVDLRIYTVCVYSVRDLEIARPPALTAVNQRLPGAIPPQTVADAGA